MDQFGGFGESSGRKFNRILVEGRKEVININVRR